MLGGDTRRAARIPGTSSQQRINAASASNMPRQSNAFSNVSGVH
jgi:hypothetical protein